MHYPSELTGHALSFISLSKQIFTIPEKNCNLSLSETIKSSHLPKRALRPNLKKKRIRKVIKDGNKTLTYQADVSDSVLLKFKVEEK